MGKAVGRRSYLTPYKERVRGKTGRAIAQRRLIPQPCEVCGVAPWDGYRRIVEAHHEDYAQPLLVRWLCPPCHRAHHRENAKARPTRLALRRLDEIAREVSC